LLASFAALVVVALALDGLLHLLDLPWVGRWRGIPGTLLIIASTVYSLRKRKLIQWGHPARLLRWHEVLAWLGSLLVLAPCSAQGHHAPRPQECSQCHRSEAWKPATFDHDRYVVLDRDHDASCVTCHNNNDYSRYTCYGCHEHSQANIRQGHVEEGIRDFENCVECRRDPRVEPEEHGGRESGRRERDQAEVARARRDHERGELPLGSTKGP